jgi:hypothetical protein
MVGILDKKKSDYDDIDHMKKVVGYVNRQQAQKPEGDVEGSNWRYSLLNWGHDPLKYLPPPLDRRSQDPCLELATGGVIARRYCRQRCRCPQILQARWLLASRPTAMKRAVRFTCSDGQSYQGSPGEYARR